MMYNPFATANHKMRFKSMNRALLMRYLILKLKQVSTVGGIGVAIVMLAKVLGFEIPSELVGPIENLALAAIAIVLFFLKESAKMLPSRICCMTPMLRTVQSRRRPSWLKNYRTMVVRYERLQQESIFRRGAPVSVQYENESGPG